jgi:ribonuclease HII
VAAAVVLPRDSELLGVDDSKKVAEDERERLFDDIAAKSLAIGIAFSHPDLIDRRNILNATLMAMARAACNLRVEPDVVLIDGRDRIELPWRVIAVKKGDGLSLSIAAASIVAKVARDRLMRKLHRKHPTYNFLNNKGYGTKDHLEAIERHGLLVEHRRSYLSKTVENLPSLF